MEVSGRKKTNGKYGDNDIFCQPCQGDGDNVQADGFCETCNEYFCSSCLNVHRKQSMSKNHVIQSINVMPRVQVQTDPCSEHCKVHKTEIVKFFCKGHNSVGCGDCMVLEHKTCKVQLVSDISGNLGNSDELKEIKQKIEELEKELGSSKVEIMKSLKAADEVKAKVIEEIITFRREMDTYLDKVEAELIKEVEQIHAKDVSQQRMFLDEHASMVNELQEFRKKLDQYSDKINQLFVTAKMAQTKLHLCQQRTKKIVSESQIHVCKFDQCVDMNTLKVNSTPIGKITTQIQKFNVKTMKDIALLKTHYVKNINVKATNESIECWITGLVILSPDEILLADYNNSSLKILNVGRNEVTSILKLSCKPWDVTVTNSQTVACTLHQVGTIMFVSTRNGLSESHSLKVRNWCRGIDHRNGVIAVSFTSPPAVQILNMKGETIHEVKDASIFNWPEYIAFRDDNNIVVSDCIEHAVYELTIDGQLKKTMKDTNLRSPRGLAVTSNGTVIVCCPDNSDSVSMVIPETREIKQLSVQNGSHPWLVLISEDKSNMYISETYMTPDSDLIKVYELK